MFLEVEENRRFQEPEQDGRRCQGSCFLLARGEWGSVDLKKKKEKNKLTSEAEGSGRAKRCGKVSEVILDFALVKGWGVSEEEKVGEQ